MLLIIVVIAIAVIATIAATGGFEPGATPTPTSIPTPTPTSTPTQEEIFPNSFRAVIVIGDHIQKLGFELFNGSDVTITIRKIEFGKPKGDTKYFTSEADIEYLISEADIAEIWGSGEVAPSYPFEGSIIFEPPLLISEVEEWKSNWHCVTADGQDFVVFGSFKESF